MPGTVTPFLDYKNSTDTGENVATSIAPITNGEQINQTTLQRPDENLRQRTEVLRAFATDSLFLQNADRGLIIGGPGRVSWPGSTTAASTGIPTLSDVLWILPMLTPGEAQAQPVPPVASKFGTLHLKRASDSMNSILVTSQRRSYAAGDQINIEVSAGGAFSCTLQTEATGAYRRTIKIVATPTTTLGDVITALNGIVPPAPDNTQLVTAALEGGALNADLILDTQARQFVSGNYDGEGHTVTPANLASFFTSNPTHALAEGDTLCVQFAMLSDTASTGGRRQAIPENGNTAITAGMFFNSRLAPEKLVNALPICKVVNGSLVFATGAEVPAGASAVSIGGRDAASVLYDGGDPWADGTTNPATTVEAQLDKVITDLATGTGTAKILGAAVNTTEIAADTLFAQLTALATNWLKLDRANTVTALQTFNGASDAVFSLEVATPPNAATEHPKPVMTGVIDAVAGIRWRLFTTHQRGIMITVNAGVTGVTGGVLDYARDATLWDGVSWGSPRAFRLLIQAPGEVKLQYFNASTAATWTDADWVDYVTLGDGVTLGAGKHVALSFGGKVTHGEYNWVVPIDPTVVISTTDTSVTSTPGQGGVVQAAGAPGDGVAYYRLPPVLSHQRIVRVVAYATYTTGIPRFSLERYDELAPVYGSTGPAATDETLIAPQTAAAIIMTPTAPGATGYYGYVMKVVTSNAGSVEIHKVEIIYDTP